MLFRSTRRLHLDTGGLSIMAIDPSAWDPFLTIRENAEALGITRNHAHKFATKHRLGAVNGHTRRKRPQVRPDSKAEVILSLYDANLPIEGFHFGYVKDVLARHRGIARLPRTPASGSSARRNTKRRNELDTR